MTSVAADVPVVEVGIGIGIDNLIASPIAIPTPTRTLISIIGKRLKETS